jgi:proteasome assembly chaperone (PAC2) family protein
MAKASGKSNSSALELFERPEPHEGGKVYMLAGWRQWADGGGVSSGLPQYLIETLGAKKIGHIRPNGFYLFQTPVSQFLFRPQIKFEEGYRKAMSGPRNDVYYWSNGKSEEAARSLVVFIGDEPHMNIEAYADAFFEIPQQLKVNRVAATGGVYAVVPFDKARNISCTYSSPKMKSELDQYAVGFSNYEGGVSIGSYMNDLAEKLDIEYFAFYAFVPMYDISQFTQRGQNISIEDDFRAWYELMQRFDHMFKLRLDLSDLANKSAELQTSIQQQVEELADKLPNVPLKEYLAKLTAGFEERTFDRLDDVWQDALGDIFNDLD